MPLEQIDGPAVEALLADEDPRVPAGPGEAERAAGRRVLRCRARPGGESEPVDVETPRPLQIGAVHVDVEDPGGGEHRRNVPLG